MTKPKDTKIEQPKTETKGKPAIFGGCLCGEVRFALSKLSDAVLCHCPQCRKAQGADFACNFPVASEDFQFIKGENKTQRYRSSENKVRVFCSSCASPIYSRRDNDATLRVRSGTLDATDGLNVVAHIFAQDLPAWSPIADELPQYARFEPTRDK